MKYLIFVLIGLNVAFAEKERGGGSLDRLLYYAGAVVENEPRVFTTHQVRKAFFELAAKFISDIKANNKRGITVYRNMANQSAGLSEADIFKVERVYRKLALNGLSIRKKIESSRGDSVGFVNDRDETNLIMSETEFERVLNIANRGLMQGLGAALVGHELLSLADIESSDFFPVSASMAEDVLWSNTFLECTTATRAPDKPLMVLLDKTSKVISFLDSTVGFPIHRVKVHLHEKAKALEFESDFGDLKIRITQVDEQFLLDYDQGERLPGSGESFLILDTQRMWCKPFTRK